MNNQSPQTIHAQRSKRADFSVGMFFCRLLTMIWSSFLLLLAWGGYYCITQSSSAALMKAQSLLNAQWQLFIELAYHHEQGALTTLYQSMISMDSHYFNSMSRLAHYLDNATILGLVNTITTFIGLVVLMIEIMVAKISILTLVLPVILLSLLVGMVDGLMMRTIRKAELGRESAYLFHYLSRLNQWLVLFGLLICLLLPIALSPIVIMLPVSVGVGLLTAFTVASFKKYV